MPDRKELALQEKKMIYYTFLVELLRGSLVRINEPKRIHKLISYLFEHRLKNRFQAIYEITRTLKKPSFTDHLEYFNAIQIIENEMIEYDIKLNANSAVDLNRFLLFNVKIVEF